jgi:[ribosomal protein S5]-alanine N-acetyltransferase
MRPITTPRLTLEPQLASHAPEMFVVLGDPAIYEFENEPPQSPEGLQLRFTQLETRLSPSGREQWLNWVIRLPNGPLAGYVQATVLADHRATIAYELNSVHWGRGLARTAVQAMLDELADRYAVRHFSAVLKQANFRSLRLLQRLGFVMASAEQHLQRGVEQDEFLMLLEV